MSLSVFPGGSSIMSTLLVGNIASFIGCSIMVCIGLLKKKTHILAAQCVQSLFMGLGYLVLGGFGGFICAIMTILRNLVCLKYRFGLGLKLLFIGLQFLLTANTLSIGLISWLPVMTTILFTMNLDTPSEVKLKSVIIITLILWLIYDFYYHNYVTFLFDFLSICSNAIGIYMIKKHK
jgi:hypothetical protein